jgi:2-acylglycerol O-acyltransferase 2
MHNFCNDQWKVVVDPFGLLEWLSVKMDVALTPFFGRGYWFLGPPHRVAVCVCCGEPIQCPKIEEPTQQEIDKYHGLLMKGYQQVFNQHKEAYGWGDKTLQFV